MGMPYFTVNKIINAIHFLSAETKALTPSSQRSVAAAVRRTGGAGPGQWISRGLHPSSAPSPQRGRGPWRPQASATQWTWQPSLSYVPWFGGFFSFSFCPSLSCSQLLASKCPAWAFLVAKWPRCACMCLCVFLPSQATQICRLELDSVTWI